mgnify:CR=1 FL=1
MNSLSETRARVWSMLEDGVKDPKAPARFVTLATVGAAGAEARILVLRAADDAAGTVTFHTDARTSKVAELAVSRNATALVWDAAERFQIRLRLSLSQRAGTAEEWAALSDGARSLYGGTPAPGDPLDRPEAHTPKPDPDQFCILTGTIAEIETLHLGQPYHARALFTRANAFKGQWITP